MEYYRTIIALFREQAGDGSYPQFIINSIDLKREIELVAAGHAKATTDYLLEEIGKLARAGADLESSLQTRPISCSTKLQRDHRFH